MSSKLTFRTHVQELTLRKEWSQSIRKYNLNDTCCKSEIVIFIFVTFCSPSSHSSPVGGDNTVESSWRRRPAEAGCDVTRVTSRISYGREVVATHTLLVILTSGSKYLNDTPLFIYWVLLRFIYDLLKKTCLISKYLAAAPTRIFLRKSRTASDWN